MLTVLPNAHGCQTALAPGGTSTPSTLYDQGTYNASYCVKWHSAYPLHACCRPRNHNLLPRITLSHLSKQTVSESASFCFKALPHLALAGCCKKEQQLGKALIKTASQSEGALDR